MSVPRSRHASAHEYQAQPASLQLSSDVIESQLGGEGSQSSRSQTTKSRNPMGSPCCGRSTSIWMVQKDELSRKSPIDRPAPSLNEAISTPPLVFPSQEKPVDDVFPAQP